jgi:hypothetical protein
VSLPRVRSETATNRGILADETSVKRDRYGLTRLARGERASGEEERAAGRFRSGGMGVKKTR